MTYPFTRVGTWVALLTAAASLVLVAPAAADEPPTHACDWISGPSLGDGTNWGWPDQGADYAIGVFHIPSGGYVELRGQFPHARYLSFTTYDWRVRGIDELNDVDLKPDPGSINPFLAGANRRATRRSYTLKIVDGRVPAGVRAPNTLYNENQDGSRSTKDEQLALVLLRLYVPDAGSDNTGGVGWPTITSVNADGSRSPAQACPTAQVPMALTPALAGVSIQTALPNVDFSGYNPPRWFKSWDSFSELYLDAVSSPITQPVPLDQIGQSIPGAGVGENPATKYIATIFSQTYRQVLMLTGRAPTYPKTYAGERTMGSGQVRYWSFCSYVETTQYIGCRHDDQIPLDAQGRYHIVVSPAASRPSNAREGCGFAWIPTTPRSLLAMREILADPHFAHAIQMITQHGTEERILGPYYPRGTYFANTTDFEKLGCHPSSAANRRKPKHKPNRPKHRHDTTRAQRPRVT